MKIAIRRHLSKLHKIVFGALSFLGYSVSVGTLVIFTSTMQLSSIAPFFLPTLGAYFALAALLYNRARAYPEGPTQRRTLYAADDVFAATILYLLALLYGACVSFFLIPLSSPIPLAKASLSNPAMFKNFIYYVPSMIFAGLSYQEFSNALRIFSRELFWPRRLRPRFKKMRKS
jgi:hypothetical protein